MRPTIRSVREADIETLYIVRSNVHLAHFYKALIPPVSQSRFVGVYAKTANGLARFSNKMRHRLHYSPPWRLWLVEYSGVVCGFVVIHESDETVELKGLYVDEGYQGKGLGTLLLETALAYSHKPMYLDVIAANTRAKTMYERHGFTEVSGPSRTYYGAALVRMIRD